MYYYGGGSGCGCGNQMYQMPYYQTGCGGNTSSNYAIILVLFILLVIVLGCRFGN
ncbi:MAG: YjcZ family sporulation protein [bacterium]|nr:YjcZ family sporulation protein [bacterium]